MMDRLLGETHLRKSFVLALTVMLLATQAPLMAGAQESPPPSANGDDYGQQSNGDDEDQPNQYYINYSEEAMNFYRKGESTKAIDLLTKALQLSPNNTAIINNLAASYIQRGVYYQNTKKDSLKALDDYRQALYLLEHEWPSDVSRSASNQGNIQILEDNIDGAMKNMSVPINDWNWHLKTAWDLRRKGQLQQAMVEYAWVTKLNPKQTESWMAMGDIYTVRQKPEKAANAYQKAVETSLAPTDSLYVKLGTALLQKGDPAKSVEAYNKALGLNAKNKDALLALEQVWNKEIVLNPRNMSAHLNLGAVYQQLGRYEDAYAQYQVADRLSPNNPLIKQNIASLLQTQGKTADAAAMYDTILKQDPNNTQVLLYKADALKQQGRPQEAEALLQKALQSSPDKKQVLDQLISVYKAQGNPDKLKSGWVLYANTFPKDPAVQYQAGLALHEVKDYSGAIGYYQKAIILKPDMSEAYANMGTALHAVNRDDEAVTALKKAITLNPGLDEVKSLISAIEQQKGSKALVEAAQLHEQGKYAEALKGYELALKQEPNNADIYARYGLALQALKRFPQALGAYDKAIALAPQNATYYYYKATIYDEQDQLEPAKNLYEKALSLDVNLSQVKQALDNLKASGTEEQLAQALDAYNKKNYPKSMQVIEQVLKLDANNATAYYYKGLVFDAQKKLEPAKVAYEKALQLDTTLSDAVYALAVVYDTQGKKEDAKRTYQQFVDLMKDQPEDAFIKYAKERVSSL